MAGLATIDLNVEIGEPLSLGATETLDAAVDSHQKLSGFIVE
jgi:hypothetical protein